MLCEGVVWNHFWYCTVEGDASEGVHEILGYIKGWVFLTISAGISFGRTLINSVCAT